MCGISGIFVSTLKPAEIGGKLQAMNAAQVHRGPDEGRTFIHEPLRSGLACRRLSIVDLEHGSQPMTNEDGSVHVVMNGEIYNHVGRRGAINSLWPTFPPAQEVGITAPGDFSTCSPPPDRYTARPL